MAEGHLAARSLASLSLQEAAVSGSMLGSGSNATSSGGHATSGSGAPSAVVPPRSAAVATKAAAAKAAFGELLPLVSPTQLVPLDDPDEAEHWSVFADVYEQEVRHQEKAAGGELQLDQRRQILADILVWAEVTTSRYDNATASFVTGPHEQDASFRRIGDMLKEAKRERGLRL
ncbi:hypothetical protein Rsub_03332 [Raphidocelis subcapitata]|uniref:Uncharacterized protein n=1 Tax=Raphidocelis subcapitata TaxID=307507 RepID=A0A2V0NS97_9CHLO|nr:hypothetical protein Rsub_03332 [Raphidocelis subcapitata]|eukprot:GBF90199.1 hypothetical protein Rsub_03332 [Raphidocelis subcapitata]